jgi:SAM-dependent methyltransferase
MAANSVYDRIGTGYVASRRPDIRIARRIDDALGEAATVVNVGAGAGSYEPGNRDVTAVEPSEVMLAQRPAGAARAVKASAEALPFGDSEFDAAMAALSIHHWGDKRRGLAEMRRVSRGPVVIFTRLPDTAPWWWLYHYFPAAERLIAGRSTSLSEYEAALGPVRLIPVPIPHDCADGFEGAYWRRPAGLLDPEVWGGMSALTLIDEQSRRRGMRRLLEDLVSGEWERRFSELLELDELDLGYRLVVSTSSANS